MNENQNTEWKESWRDEYLKWICGFANATGGRIYIGMNDNGKVVGVADADKLLEDIPNKVRDVLGIIVDVNLLEENGLKYIEIDVPPYSNPINYKGQYHYRSGSTKQELKGAALNRFILQALGRVSHRVGRHRGTFPQRIEPFPQGSSEKRACGRICVERYYRKPVARFTAD
mgnify:CR=1 FL=1